MSLHLHIESVRQGVSASWERGLYSLWSILEMRDERWRHAIHKK